MLLLLGRQRGSKSLCPEIRTASMTAGVERRGSLLLEGKNQGKDRKVESKKDEKGIELMGYERFYFHFNVYIKIDVVLLIFVCLFVI